MKFACWSIAAVAMLSSAPLLAQTQPTAAAPAPTEIVVPAMPAAVPAPPAAKERIICRRELDIGSFVRGTRRCATVSEWRKSSDAARDTTSRIQEQKGLLQGN